MKRIFEWLVRPHRAVLAVLVPISAVLVIYALASERIHSILQYFSYFLSAYTLTVLCVRLPKVYETVKRIKTENKYTNMYFSDPELRVKLSLYISFVCNVFYALIQVFLGIKNHSVWFYSLAIYYFSLALMRFFLLRGAREDILGKNVVKEYKKYRMCGIVLLFMNVSVSVITAYIVWTDRGFSYGYIMTIAMAVYTFFVFTFAIVNMIKCRKYNSPIMSASKQISFSAALVSMLTLESAMLNVFGDGNEQYFDRIMVSCTGSVVCIAVLSMAVYMIMYSSKKIKGDNRG